MGETTRALSIARERVCGPEVHDALRQTEDLGLITSMRSLLGDEFVIGVTGADPLTLDEWCEGWLSCPREAEERLRVVDAVFATFADHLVPHADALAWFTTPSLSLGGNTPVATLRNASPTEAAPMLLVAARASIV